MAPEFIEMGESETDSISEGDFQGNETDLPPEYCQYRDEGCDLADSCLNCSFPHCIYEQPGGKQRWLKKLRNREISRLFTDESRGVKELALRFGVSERTVQRALRNTLKVAARGNTLDEGELSENE